MVKRLEFLEHNEIASVRLQWRQRINDLLTTQHIMSCRKR